MIDKIYFTDFTNFSCKHLHTFKKHTINLNKRLGKRLGGWEGWAKYAATHYHPYTTQADKTILCKTTRVID